MLVTVGLLAIAGIAASAESQSPFVGTWVLNVAKSTFDPGPPMKSHVSTITEAPGGGFHESIHLVERDGTRTHMEFTTPLDGKYVPVSGTDYADSVSLTKTGDRSFKYSFKKAGKRIESGTFTVSEDGKTLVGALCGNDGGVIWKNITGYLTGSNGRDGVTCAIVANLKHIRTGYMCRPMEGGGLTARYQKSAGRAPGLRAAATRTIRDR